MYFKVRHNYKHVNFLEYDDLDSLIYFVFFQWKFKGIKRDDDKMWNYTISFGAPWNSYFDEC